MRVSPALLSEVGDANTVAQITSKKHTPEPNADGDDEDRMPLHRLHSLDDMSVDDLHDDDDDPNAAPIASIGGLTRTNL